MKIPKARYVRHYRNPGWRNVMIDEIMAQAYELSEKTLLDMIAAVEKDLEDEDLQGD